MRRLEEVSLQPVHPAAVENDALGLPSYEQAIAKSGQHDAPPPPYPGYLKFTFQLFRFFHNAVTERLSMHMFHNIFSYFWF